MDFALFSHVPWPEGVDAKQVYDDITEEFVLGEELGFKSAWMAEHHFTRYGLGAAPNVLASSIVAKTTTLRIGSAIFVSPLHLPARLAEEIAISTLLALLAASLAMAETVWGPLVRVAVSTEKSYGASRSSGP